MKPVRKLIGVAALAVLGATSTQAAIVSQTGAVTLLGSAPASVMEGALESDTAVHAFNEKQGLTLSSGLLVNFVAPGFSGNGTIAAGTRISSHFVHFDSVDGGGSPTTLTGSLSFDAPILGLIFTAARLNSTDMLLGAVGTAYPGGVAGRQFASGEAFDFFSISGGQLTFNFGSRVADGFVDQMRVVTAAVPTPGSLALVGVALLALAGVGHRRSAR